MPDKRYTSDLTVEQYDKIATYLPTRKKTAPRKVSYHRILNAIFYRLKNGCSWRDLPQNFPNEKTVLHYFNRWKKEGVWGAILDDLRVENRTAVKKKGCPPC